MAMRQGRTYADVAVYLPLEDVWMAGELPDGLQKPSSKYVYELQETKLPRFLKGYHPLWVTAPFLEKAEVHDGWLHCGEARFRWLYVDAGWLDFETVNQLLRLGRQGLPICLVQSPREPGRVKHSGYTAAVAALRALPCVTTQVSTCVTHLPLVAGEDLPDFWCVVRDEQYSLFFANPHARSIRYPMRYGQALEGGASRVPVQFNLGSRSFKMDLVFEPGESILLRISPSGVEMERSDFVIHENPLHGEQEP